MRAVIRSVVQDKADGRYIELLPDSHASLRVCCCTLDQIESLAGNLMPGTVVMTESENVVLQIEEARRIFAAQGLEGFGYRQDGNFFWGVSHPGQLSAEAIVASHFRNAGLGG